MELIRCGVVERRPTGIESAVFSPCGKQCAIGREEGSIEIYDVDTWHVKFILAGGPTQSARTLCWITPSLLVSAGLHGNISEWNVTNNSVRPEHVTQTGGGAVWSMCIASKPIRNLDGVQKKNTKNVKDEDSDSDDGQEQEGGSSSSSSGSHHFFVACDDGGLRWFVRNNAESSDLSLRKTGKVNVNSLTKNNRLLSVACSSTVTETATSSHTTNYVFTGDARGRICRWELPSLTCDATMNLTIPHSGPNVRAQKIMENLAKKAAQKKKKTKFEETDSNEELPATTELRLAITNEDDDALLVWTLQSIRNGAQLASGDNFGRVTIWDVVTCTQVQSLRHHQADVCCLGYVPQADTRLASNDVGEQFLVSAGMDATICLYSVSNKEDEDSEWLFNNVTFGHSHDIRTIAISPTTPTSVVSGGVDATINILPWNSKDQHFERHPIQLSPYSYPLPVHFTKNGIALIQKENHAEIWFMNNLSDGNSNDNKIRKIEKENGFITYNKKFVSKLPLEKGAVPQPQRLIDARLQTEGHLLSSALAPDAELFALSNIHGTRVFEMAAQDLKLRRMALDEDILEKPATALHFISKSSLVVCAAPSDGYAEVQILKIDDSTSSVMGTFQNHEAPITHVTSYNAEWLCTADAINGSLHLYNLDKMEHHCVIPSFSKGVPTAINFSSAAGLTLIATSSAHELMLFDVEKKKLRNDIIQVPEHILQSTHRISGIVPHHTNPQRMLLWTPRVLVKVQLDCKDPEEDKKRKNKKRKGRSADDGFTSEDQRWQAEMRFWWTHALLSLEEKKQEKRKLYLMGTTEEKMRSLLPPQFERKVWGN